MKTRLLIIIGIIMISFVIPQTFGTYFEIDGYNIITNSPNVSAIDIDWDSEHLSEFSVNFTESYTGQFQIQIPKNMPRTMNLDFETTLMMDVSSLSSEDLGKNWNEHIIEKDFKMIDDRVSETESLCYYIITVELSKVDYFKIVTGTVSAGRWEPVIIENDSCDDIYDGLTMKSELRPLPEPPYFENIDKEKPCGKGTTYQDGMCIVNQIENSNQTKNQNNKWPAAYQDMLNDSEPEPPLSQLNSGISIMDVTCKDGLSIGYKKDLSKVICVTPETLFKLDRNDWVFRNYGNSYDPSVYGNDTAVLCANPDDEVVSFGFSKRESNLTVKVSSFERIQYDGFPGALITYDREFDGGMSRGANNGYFPYVHCINESVDTFDKCMNVSHHFSSVNYPIVSCLTLDGKKFSYDEVEAMSRNSGIELYSMNYLSSASLEFVGKTDRIDQEISFSITTPSGNEIFTWSEFPPDEIKFEPDESEFRTVITTGGPLWEQEDGIYTFTAKQIDVPYYLASLEFELKDGKMVR